MGLLVCMEFVLGARHRFGFIEPARRARAGRRASHRIAVLPSAVFAESARYDRRVDSRTKELDALLARVNGGDETARAELFALVYAELRRIAASHLRGARAHTLQPTALVHEAILKLSSAEESRFNDRAHVLAAAVTAMRQIVMNHARARRAAKRGGAWNKVALDEGMIAVDEPELDLLVLDDALSELAEIDARKHRVVELRFFGGLSVEEVARVLSLSTTTIESEWRAARVWLERRLRG
jgi:RNA polymerase sigma factor (TIGR02999 family)